jgi:tRNA pseudouridine55 synthase
MGAVVPIPAVLLLDRLHAPGTEVGHLSVGEAVEPDKLARAGIRNRIIHANVVISHLPAVEVDEEGALAVRSGRVLHVGRIEGSFRVEREGELLAVYRGAGEAAKAEVVLCGG